MKKNIQQEATTYLILSYPSLMLAQFLGVIPFVLSMVYFIKVKKGGEAADPRQMSRLRTWIIFTLLLALIDIISAVTILFTALSGMQR